ncbi:MAG: hypothetical protein M5U13_15605 [Thermoanaerobaculia bacterium]|nr:hypothetical protein [Thermoanaerobaculia bacterium]
MSDSAGFRVANDDCLVRMIEQARQKVVMIAPGLTQRVAEALRDRAAALGANAVTVITDVSEIPYRIGFGEPAGLSTLRRAANSGAFALHDRPGLRLGMLVSDGSLLVFSPTPQAIENQPEAATGAPNALLVSLDEPGAEQALLSVAEATPREVGARPADEVSVRRVEKALEENPPKQFDVTRTEWVFNSVIEFVEFEFKGSELPRKRATLPPDLLNLTGDRAVKNLISATFRLLEGDSSPVRDGIEALKSRKKQLADRFLVSLPGHGAVIRRAAKKRFLDEFAAFERDVDGLKQQLRSDLEATMQTNVDQVVKALLPGVVERPPERYLDLGCTVTISSAPRLIERDLRDAFGSIDELLHRFRVELRFKGVTYESLHDPEFRRIAAERLPDIEVLHEEHEAARTRSPGTNP